MVCKRRADADAMGFSLPLVRSHPRFFHPALAGNKPTTHQRCSRQYDRRALFCRGDHSIFHHQPSLPSHPSTRLECHAVTHGPAGLDRVGRAVRRPAMAHGAPAGTRPDHVASRLGIPDALPTPAGQAFRRPALAQSRDHWHRTAHRGTVARFGGDLSGFDIFWPFSTPGIRWFRSCSPFWSL
jgi:hypothetical protein